MANTKVTQDPAATTVLGTDLASIVTDPGGTPTSKKITFLNLINSLVGIVTTKLGLAVGGTNADLSASGSATAVLAQAADHSISARALVAADLPIAYVEGTWTATLRGSVADPTTPVTATGTYTKIGRLVFARVAFTNKDTTGGSGNMSVSGLPFTPTSHAEGSVGSYNLAVPGLYNTPSVENGSTVISFYSHKNNDNWAIVTLTAGASKYLNISIVYEA